MSIWLFLLHTSSVLQQARASDIANTDSPQTRVSPERLPRCIDQSEEVNAIKTSVQARIEAASHAKVERRGALSPKLYEAYQTRLTSDSGEEIWARLAYAETLAANCPALQSAIAPLIVEVIGNRIRKRISGDVRSVVFQPKQFASSLHFYKESRYKDFLCPSDKTLWAGILETIRAGARQLSPETVNYYLYKHNPRFKVPRWKLKEDIPKSKKPIADCIRFFKDPNWN